MPPLSRAAWTLANLLLGILPSFLFFVWIERNAALPFLPVELGWPWIRLETEPLALLIAWNFGLIAAFGFVHSALAQRPAQRALARWVPAQAVRTVYVVVTGVSLTAVMGLWQHTGRVVWVLPLPSLPLNVLSIAVFWGFLLVALKMLTRFGASEFVGLRQLGLSAREIGRTEGSPVLNKTGLYGLVRHPIYSFTGAAIVLAPVMSLDRAIAALAMGAYLAIGVPIEERKLISLFGRSYEDYRKRVPAVIPRLSSLLGSTVRRSHSHRR